MSRLALAGVGAVLLSAVSAFSSQIPGIVSERMKEANKSCEGRPDISSGYLTKKGDVYIIDFSHFACPNLMQPECGSAGCLREFYAKKSGAYRLIKTDRVPSF
jgi:hypothetical protein